MHPRVLIVGTVPYNKMSTSRAFDAYFHNWEKENLTQIFSNTKTPCKGHCGSLYQITDHAMLHRWFVRKTVTGKIYNYDELPDEWSTAELEVDGTVMNAAYKVGRRHTPLTHLLRGLLWRKKFWCTDALNEWMDSFAPECIFLAFSDDYFILKIALYAAERYNIPIVSCIGDDYYFNKHFSVNPIYQLYKESYKALVRKVLSHRGSAIYISDKIRDKYNSEFGLDGETVYLTSNVKRKPFCPINLDKPLITYFGNIRIGRNKSLAEIADALGAIDSKYKVEVYSTEKEEEYYSVLKNNPYVIYGGAIPYAQVEEKMQASDITLVVEGFAAEDIEMSRYSLSTKAADALASGAAIFTYGSADCGIVEYMASTHAAEVCTQKEQLKQKLRRLLEDVELQKRYYKQQIVITQEHHNLQRSCEISEQVIMNAIGK